jgi:hypothetical protein
MIAGPALWHGHLQRVETCGLLFALGELIENKRVKNILKKFKILGGSVAAAVLFLGLANSLKTLG